MDTTQQPLRDSTPVPEQQQPQEQPPAQEQQQTMEQPPPANFKVMASEETKVNPSYHNGYNSDSNAQYSSRPAEFNPPRDPTSQDAELNRLTSSPSITYQPQPPSSSRPSSAFSSGAERHGVSQQQSEPSQRSQAAKNSVVLKVGMVGDAQIGKTSLMVKYVEGSWDEDYIQTLGESAAPRGGEVLML